MEANTLQAKDLRIGNIVFSKISGGLIMVQYIPIDIDMDNYGAVKLTEDVLVKLGFEEVYNSEFTHKFELTQDVSFEYRFEKFNNASGMTGLTYYGRLLGNIRFVHQLQNLYFAITNEELTIKE